MGFNNEHATSGALVFDCETAAHPLATAYVDPLDLSSIAAAKNLKDPDKIAADIQKRQAEAQAEHDTKLSRCALDFNLCRVVALAWMDADDAAEAVTVYTCANEDEEAVALREFWRAAQRYQLIGFRIRTFDAPLLMTRSRYLGVPYPALDLGRYARNGRIVDLWDALTFGLSDYETTVVMSRKLTSYARRYGLPVEDTVKGSEIPRLVLEGDWDSVVAHVTSDVQLTAALARRIGVLRAIAPMPGAF